MASQARITVEDKSLGRTPIFMCEFQPNLKFATYENELRKQRPDFLSSDSFSTIRC